MVKNLLVVSLLSNNHRFITILGPFYPKIKICANDSPDH